MNTRLSLAIAFSSTIPAASAQDLLVMRFSPSRIERYSAQDGTLLDPLFVDIDGLVGFNGVFKSVWDCMLAPNGEIWVSNSTSELVHRFTADGQSYLQYLPVAVGRAFGLTAQGGKLWIAAGTHGYLPAGARAYDIPVLTQSSYIPATDIWDVHDFEGDVLLCRSNGTIDRVDSTTGAVTLFSSPGGACQQAFTRANGELLVGNSDHEGYDVIAPSGVVIRSHHALGAGRIRGVAELATGRVLLSSTHGVYVYDPVAGGVTQLSQGNGAYIGLLPGGFEWSSSCTSIANSTGSVAGLLGTGSNLVASNDVRLIATAMPLNAFGFFLTSRNAGSVANPGGSQGVLCLDANIGRYVGPGQIMSSGATGSIALQIDLTSMPQPTIHATVLPGETWHFQAWFRDAIGGSATSNFTNGMTAVFH